MNGKIQIATFGRERDKEFIELAPLDQEDKKLLLSITDAVHDLRDGKGSIDDFLDEIRAAAWSKHECVKDPALTMLMRVSCYYPECLQIWVDLAQEKSWSRRFAVACRLYRAVPERLSDQIFSILRNDKSKRVRDISNDRYQWRPDAKGYLEKIYDASKFDERVRRGEVELLCLIKS